ncbi:MAG: DUF1566 domain-containing protein [Patescibacteria group bacterium]
MRRIKKKFTFTWFNFYIFLIILISLAFISLNLLADFEETPANLQDYFNNQNCPQLADSTDLTVKDVCTGLVWVRHELPTFKIINDPKPGYAWQEAADKCAALEPAGMFRLPTVEELLSLVKYKCDETGCQANADIVNDQAGTRPSFSGGIYWTGSDFNETAAGIANPQRDYKRTVNLLNGKADNPIFAQDMKLNVLCIMDRQPEIFERKFISATTSNIANGAQVTRGELQTIYHRDCTEASQCLGIGATACISLSVSAQTKNFCAKTEAINLTTPRIVGCNSGFHIEGSNCVTNAGTGDLNWLGTAFNGLWAKAASGAHIAPSITVATDKTSYVYPASVILSATASASSPSTITSVDFYYNNTNYIGTVTEPIDGKYIFTWSNMSMGAYEIIARAIDSAGSTSLSAGVNITVGSNTPPSVTIATDPAYDAAGISGPADVAINVSAHDPDGNITLMKIYQRKDPGGVDALIADCSSINNLTNIGGPDFTGSCTWLSVPIGNYIITARAIDNNGGMAEATAQLKLVNQPPSVAITQIIYRLADGSFKTVAGADLNNAHFPPGENLEIHATASDDVRVNEVRFYNGPDEIEAKELICRNNNLRFLNPTPCDYVVTWKNVPAGSYGLKAIAFDNGGQQTISDTIYIIVSPEICGNNSDDDGNGQIDENCYPFMINVHDYNANNDEFTVYIAPEKEDTYEEIGVAALFAGATFNQELQSGKYNIKVEFKCTDDPKKAGTPEVEIIGSLGVSKVVVSEPSVTGRTSSCDSVGLNKYDCKLNYAKYTNYPSCTVLNTNSLGTAIFPITLTAMP